MGPRRGASHPGNGGHQEVLTAGWLLGYLHGVISQRVAHRGRVGEKCFPRGGRSIFIFISILDIDSMAGLARIRPLFSPDSALYPRFSNSPRRPQPSWTGYSRVRGTSAYMVSLFC